MESTSNDLRAIQILYKALLAGQILFLLISILLVESGKFPPQVDLINVLLGVASILCMTGIIFGYALFKRKIADIKIEDDFTTRIGQYRAASILQWSLSEAPALLCIVSYLLSASRLFWIPIAILLINFLYLYPSKTKIVQQLQLNGEEEARLGQ